MGAILAGIDVGGTFTDLMAVDVEAGTYHFHKLPSTPHNPAEAALAGLAELLRQAGAAPRSLASLSHGTTVATNAILERRYAPTAMITTAGFRDVLELARQRRPELWNLDADKPDTIVRRDRRFELSERVDARGEVVREPRAEDIAAAVAAACSTGVSAIAICFLHAYANDVHEEATAQALHEAAPDVRVCKSSEVVGEFREYERFCSTVLNASLLPVMDRYLDELETGARELGAVSTLRVMQSNGGIMSARVARMRPIATFLSGPAAGVVGAVPVATATGRSEFITFDMGGTSTDVCLVEGGRAPIRREQTVGGLPIRTPTVDIHTVGAGGGSLGWVDAGGLLKVGPRSAGSRPGPACYGQGGSAPTVTDANVLLGRLNSQHLLGGRMRVDRDAAERAVQVGVGEPLGFDVMRAAAGIVRIVNANMVQAIRVVSVERGHDPRDFSLVAFGGAGPLHAAEVARELGIRKVVVPQRPGLLCALGLLHSELRADFSRTRLIALEPGAEEPIGAVFAELEAAVDTWRSEERLEGDVLTTQRLVDARYAGQDFELQIPLAAPPFSSSRILALGEAFHRAHDEFYGYASPGQPVEVVAARIVVSGERPMLPENAALPEPGDCLSEERQMWFEDTGLVTAPVYFRERIPTGQVCAGPAVIEQMDSSTVVPPGMFARAHASGSLVLEWS